MEVTTTNGTRWKYDLCVNNFRIFLILLTTIWRHDEMFAQERKYNIGKTNN